MNTSDLQQEKALLLQCRSGFESDCAAEIQDRAGRLGIAGYCRAQPGDAHVLFQAYEPEAATRLMAELDFRELIFARQWFVVLAELRELPVSDRAGPVAAAFPLRRARELSLEYPDTNEGKALSAFCRKFSRPLENALTQRGLKLGHPAEPRLHVFFLDSSHAFVGLSDPANSAAWPLGIPRLRMPRQAPSRSTLKLEEALLLFLDEEERDRRLKPGLSAIDLGASPGGWTWQLARRGLRVTAVDNGPMSEEVMATGMVEHLRADGFTYRPEKMVDWLVCDMVEQPSRIAGLMADYLAEGYCREAVFNLKLPMKKRYQAVQNALHLIDRRLRRSGLDFTLACKQLYHDREEVTVHLRRL